VTTEIRVKPITSRNCFVLTGSRRGDRVGDTNIVLNVQSLGAGKIVWRRESAVVMRVLFRRFWCAEEEKEIVLCQGCRHCHHCSSILSFLF
jgi:hypothetical protein